MPTQKVSRKHALNVGKSLRSYFPKTPLSTCQEWAARLLGYRDLHEITAAEKSGSLRDWIPDEDVSSSERLQRRQRQAEVLAKDSGVPLSHAEEVIAMTTPTAMKQLGDEARPNFDAVMPMGDRAFLALVDYLEPATQERLDSGLKAAIALFESGLSPGKTGITPLHLLIDATFERPHTSELLLKALQLTVDAGAVEFAYTLGNRLRDDWGDLDDGSINVSGKKGPPRQLVKRVDALYELVINAPTLDHEWVRSAALVHRTAFTRDGWLTGKPDWPAAVALYGKAGDMGNLIGAFNAGNVADWLQRQGKKEYAAISSQWALRTVEMVDSRSYLKGATHPSTVLELRDQAINMIHQHVFAGHLDPASNPAVAAAVAEHDKRYPRARVDRKVNEFERMVVRAGMRPRPTPGANWQQVLTMCGWIFSGHGAQLRFTNPGTGMPVTAEVLECNGKSGRTPIKLVVINHPCLPIEDGEAVVAAGLQAARKAYKDADLLCVGRKGIVQEFDDIIFTAAWVLPAGSKKTALASFSAWNRGPEAVLEQVEQGRSFGQDMQDSSPGYLFAIAINTLDEGVEAARTADGRVMWIGVGDKWQMPYYDLRELVYHRLADPAVVLQQGD